MFRKSRADQAKAQVQDAASTASHHLREKVAPVVAEKARDAKDWATPHVERGLEAAAPKVEAAVDKVSPAVDAARDKIVDDLLPRLVEAVNAAAAAGAGAAATGAVVKARSGDAVAVLKGDAVAKPKRRGRKLLLFSALVAAVGAAVAVFKKQQPREDPWAVPAGSYPSTSSFGSSASSSTSSALGTGAASSSLDAAGPGEAEVTGLTPDSAAAAEAIAESAGEESGEKADSSSTTTSDDAPRPTEPSADKPGSAAAKKTAAKKFTPPKS
ncbi:MAG: hypothetical protein ACTHLJ_12110 [Angustibacter sp.]